MPRNTNAASPWALVGAPLPDRLAAAQDPASTAELLTVIAPSLLEGRDPALTAFVLAVVRHPACPGTVASRYIGHQDPEVRRAVLDVPGLPGTTLDALARDSERDIHEGARALLDELGDCVRDQRG